MKTGNILLILAGKELRDAQRNRWFLLFTLAFAGLTVALAWLSLAGVGTYGIAGFGRTTAGLVNVILLIVPLMGLTLGAMSVAGERDRGTLLYLLAQPITRLELLLGKFIGLAAALLGTLAIGFGLAGSLVMLRAGVAQWELFGGLVMLTGALAIVALSLGILISTAAPRGATAVGGALLVWLVLVFFGDLGVMGTAVVLRLQARELLALSLLNPLQVFKIAAVINLRQNLEIFGPAGVYAWRTYGEALLPLLSSLLLFWMTGPLLIAGRLFQRRGGL